ncbi:MAG TPA: hypothetical protein VN841_27220 [Bryobacteraceae bacterium]|nr:hypothetical protein [Bryobacteraceae bacterium]
MTGQSIIRCASVLCLLLPVSLLAQGRGGGRAGQPASPKAAAPVDLTGYWVSIVTEDWRFRMVTPKKGDYPSIPLNAEGRKVADAWDPAKDAASGNACKSYGAANLLRNPGRLHITWENDDTLRIDTDAGTQTRLLHFGAVSSSTGVQTGEPQWQGVSVAQWELPGPGGRRAAAVSGGDLKSITTHMRPGYLQKNGVPYSGNAVLTEYFHRTVEDNGDSWLIVTTIVEDPQYLTTPFLRSTHFKKEADGSKWDPSPCEAQ